MISKLLSITKLGVLLETGGCTARTSTIVKPDPFYVDQALNTLEHLQEMGIPLVCEKWLSLPNNPPLMDIDEIFTTAAKAKKLDITSGGENVQGAQTAGVVLKRTKSLDFSGSSGSERSISPRHRRDRSDETQSSYEMSTAFRGEVISSCARPALRILAGNLLFHDKNTVFVSAFLPCMDFSNVLHGFAPI